MGLTLHTSSTDETVALAASLAPLIEPGDAITLDGELGAGKTTFVRGLVRALGGDEAVTSPTFTIHQPYAARLPINHFDLYRLEEERELQPIGLDEALQAPALTLIEWPALALSLVPERLELTFVYTGMKERDIAFRPVGGPWERRLAEWLA